MQNLFKLISYLTNLLIIIGLLCVVGEVKAQQGGTVTYGYDANGRLTSVTLPTGESVKYSYDPAGNITAIERLSGPGPQFFSFTPQFGFVGDTVTFTGNNFGNITSISFNGTNATVFSGNMTQITATVPNNATTGQITVTLSNGTFTTSTFSVLAIQINPNQASVLPNQTQQFTANVPSQLNNNNVTWSVNGVNGGNSTVGTISSAGLYTAPNISTTQTFTIGATSVVRPTAFAQASVKVSPDLYQLRTALTVQYKLELFANQQFARVSVLKGQIVDNKQIVQPRNQVSILKGQIAGSIQNLPIYSPPVSISSLPIITSISPSSLSRGSSNNITIGGSNLSGTTTLVFINATTGAIDTSISVSNLSVAGDGNSLTATINVASNSTTGNRVVVISGATTGHSTTSNITNNIISIIP